MDVEMGLPSPKTPSMKRVFQSASPRIIEVPRTPRSEGFGRRKGTQKSSGDVDCGQLSFSKSVWNSDTPPMSDSSGHSAIPFKDITRDPTTDIKDPSPIAISESRFYNGSTNRKCLLPLFRASGFRGKQEVKEPTLKRKRSKSLDHRKRSEPQKLNKNIGHKIKRPKMMKPQKPHNSSVTKRTETLDLITLPPAPVHSEKIDFAGKTRSPTSFTNVKLKLQEKKLSVNVNRMVRVNIQGGELRFTKHIKSPKKTPNSAKAEQMAVVDGTSELFGDWFQNKVDNIIVNLDKENTLSDISSSVNGSTSLNDSTAHLSDALGELEVSEVETALPAAESSVLTGRVILKTHTKEKDENPLPAGGEKGSSSQEGDSSMEDPFDKLYPVFYKTNQVKTRDSPKTGSTRKYRKCSLPAKSTDGLEQLIIDAGQKSLAPSSCAECGFYYQTGDSDEEKMHLNYHNSTKPVIKHTGWKWERVAATFPDGRVVHVCPSDPKPWWVKIETVLDKANQDLGISFGSQLPKHAHAYFFVSNTLILGCVIAEPIRVAYRMLESDRKELERLKEPGDESILETPSFCSNTPVRGSRCGINRIWTCASERRKGIATKMLDAVRATFVYGHILKLSEIAFSDPTPMGMALAVKYTNSPNFFVYKMFKD